MNITKCINDKFKNIISEMLDLRGTVDDKELYSCLDVIQDSFGSANYRLRAILDEFPITEDLEHVYLFDLKRNMFWRQNSHGYTKFIEEAGLFMINKALADSNNDMDGHTKIVYFED